MEPYTVNCGSLYEEENGIFYKIYRRCINYLPYMWHLSPDERDKVMKIVVVKREPISEREYKNGKDYCFEPISHTEPPENY